MILRKIKSFLQIVLEKKNNLRWGRLGYKSKVVKPIRVIGKNHIYIGNRVVILNHARIETVQRKWGGQTYSGELYIEDETSIGQNCHIVAAGKLRIGNACVFSGDVFISDCSHSMIPGKKIYERELVVKETRIGDNVFIGIGARILPGVHIGNNAVIGANAVVTHDVPENATVVGVPARVIK